METTLRELEAHLPEFIRRVVAGEEVTVTAGGKPVLKLSPVKAEPTPEDLERDALARLDAWPWIEPDEGGPILGAAHPIPWQPGEQMLSDIVSEMRE
jgi:prevent-host-death family protein